MHDQQTGKSATDILRVAHSELQKLFADYQATDSLSEQEDITKALSLKLRQHILMEEQLFFPTISKVMPADAFVDAAAKELEQATLLIDRLQRLYPAEDRKTYDETMMNLRECVEHHIQSEEKCFPK